MKGTNVIARTRTVDLNVHSVFQTIQGEGPFSGHPAIFVRFAGCNLQCTFCDTDFDKGEIYTPEALAKKLIALRKTIPGGSHYRYVLTGGEPMLQPLVPLIALLQSLDKNVQIDIETAGTVWPVNFDQVKDRVHIVCSPKTPKLHPELRWAAHAWKYIIKAGCTAANDGLPCGSTQRPFADYLERIYRPAMVNPEIVWVQPCDEGDAEKNKANQEEAVHSVMQFGYRLSLQIHKIVGLP